MRNDDFTRQLLAIETRVGVESDSGNTPPIVLPRGNIYIIQQCIITPGKRNKGSRQ